MSALPVSAAAMLVAVDGGALAKLLQRRVNNGSAPGPSGWTGAHLAVLASSKNDKAWTGLCALIKDICNGRFDGDVRDELLSCTLMPLWKQRVGGGIRPIAIGETLVKLAAHYSMSLIDESLPKLFPRIQYGVKRPGGSEAAAQLTRALVAESHRQHINTVALKTDFANAFNATSRAEAWRVLQRHPETQAMWRMFHWAYASASPLLVFDNSRLHTIMQSAEGMRQGDPFAAFVFALCVQTLYERAIDGLPDCKAVSVLDDLTLVGPLPQVMQAYDRIKQLAAGYHLNLRSDKCQVFVPPQLSDAAALAAIHAACAERALQHNTHIEALGVMFGTDNDVRSHASDVVSSHERFFAALTHPSMPVQIGFSILRHCGIPRLGFLSRTVPPKLFDAAARQFDQMARDCFDHMMQIDAVSRGLLAPLLTEQQVATRLSLPLRMGGMGMRPVARISHAAYFSSLATVMPDFLSAFPNCADVAHTSIHAELAECRAQLIANGTLDAVKSVRAVHLSAASPLMQRRAASEVKRAPVSSSQFASARAASAGPGEATRQLIRGDLTHLWESARAASTSVEQSHNFLRGQQLQHTLTTWIELQEYARLFPALSRYQQAVLTATALTSHSNNWLTVLPTLRPYSMSNSAFRLSVRHRMGLLPFDSLIAYRCTSDACGNDTSFANDPDHLHSCHAHRRTLVTQRHNNIMQVLSTLARSVGFYCSREPNNHVRPASLVADAGSEQWNDHADLLLIKHDRRLYVDVSVCRPTNQSLLKQPRVTFEALCSTRDRARVKHAKYDAIARENAYEMLPFVMETYGGMGVEASKLLAVLAEHADDKASFLTHAHNSLSVCLQASNATLAAVGTQMLHTQQRVWLHGGGQRRPTDCFSGRSPVSRSTTATSAQPARRGIANTAEARQRHGVAVKAGKAAAAAKKAAADAERAADHEAGAASTTDCSSGDDGEGEHSGSRVGSPHAHEHDDRTQSSGRSHSSARRVTLLTSCNSEQQRSVTVQVELAESAAAAAVEAAEASTVDIDLAC